MSALPEDAMAPEASPGTPSRGVRRVNNLPVYIVAGLIGVFLLIMVLVASDRAKNQTRTAEPRQQQTGSTAMFAKELAGDRKDGIIQAQAANPPTAPDLTAVDQPASMPILRPANLDLPPAPPTSDFGRGQAQSGQRTAADEEAAKLRMMKLQQFEEAAKAKTGIQVVAPRSTGSPPTGSANGPSASNAELLARLAASRQQIDAVAGDDTNAAYQARLSHIRQLRDGAGVGDGAGTGGDATKLVQANAGADDMGRFRGNSQVDRWRLESKPDAPRTPYELRAGFVVPAVLISGINSELPGTIMAQVSQDVYDTPTGKWKLIPQGSRLVGAYANSVAYGQSRVLVAWQRIVFPDGKAMDIGTMPGADGAGYAGFEDQINNHYLRVFGSAFLMSAVTAGIAKSQPVITPYGSPSFESALSQSVGQELGQVTAQLIAKNLNVAPTLEVRPGFRFNVIVTKDMTFSKPYQPFDY